MTREEAEAELSRRWRLRVVLEVVHGEADGELFGKQLRGSTMGESLEELRAAAHGLLDVMLNRLAAPAREDA